jgi:hypothetical protein
MAAIRARPLFLAVTFPLVVFAAEPPTFYIDRGACPFECCTYGTWRAKTDTRLFAEPKLKSQQVGSVPKGTSVQALTGEVHTVPGKLKVLRDASLYKAGDVLWVYTYLGEGIYKVWQDGKMVEEEIDVGPGNQQPHAWATWEKSPRSQWWAKIKLNDGTIGWTNKPRSFRGIDRCE